MTTDRAALQDLRRVADALDRVRGRVLDACAIRSDLRHLRLELSDGYLLMVGVDVDEQGRPRLQVDVARQPEEATRQLEVFGAR
jgi:hypothetical protein